MQHTPTALHSSFSYAQHSQGAQTVYIRTADLLQCAISVRQESGSVLTVVLKPIRCPSKLPLLNAHFTVWWPLLGYEPTATWLSKQRTLHISKTTCSLHPCSDINANVSSSWRHEKWNIRQLFHTGKNVGRGAHETLALRHWHETCLMPTDTATEEIIGKVAVGSLKHTGKCCLLETSHSLVSLI